MQHQDKIDKIFESADTEELLSWVQVHAYVDEKFALAILERFWKPDQEDEKAIVERCFMNPSYIEGLKYNWTAIEQDLTKLMPTLKKIYKDGEFIRSAYLAGYIITITCKAYREDFYTQYEERIKPIMEYVRRAEEIVREVLIEGETIDEDSRIGILSEICKECEEVKDVPVFRIDRFLEQAYCVTMPMKAYLSYVNKLLKRKRDYNRDFHVINKTKCLIKHGCWDKAKAFLEKEVKEEKIRALYVDLLIEYGEFRHALDIAEVPESILHIEDWIVRQIKILDMIKDDELAIDFCRRHFITSYYRWEYYKKLKNTVPVSEWKEFLEDLLHDCDFYCDVDRAEIKIYIEEGMLDRIYPYCERKGEHSVIENLKNYSKFLTESQQESLARSYSDWVIKRANSEDMMKSKKIKYIAAWIKELYDCSEAGANEAKKLLQELTASHPYRRAIIYELHDLKYKGFS